MKCSEKGTSYDEIPYESNPFPQSHPDRLATMGRLFGLSPAPVTRCRVLELGCASGGNLIPMAYNLPQSEFEGVDLSTVQVQVGRDAVEELGLKNIRIDHASITDVDRSWGLFDYIIAHGVYSWVPDDVQDYILAIASQNLTPQGIAYVSYNTYPGWHMREMIRHMMLYHANQFEKTIERIDQARALVDFLARSVPTQGNHYGLLLKRELDLMKHSSDSYLFHDHMEEVNAPVYFYQFVERADSHGLQYLSEANFSSMLTSGFSGEVAETLDRITQDIIRNEQYMDFVRNRQFRQTLLCRKGLSPKRALGGEDVRGLLVASDARPEKAPVDLSPGVKQSFGSPDGPSVETDFALTKAALMALIYHWPRALDLDTLYSEASRRLENPIGHTEADVRESKRALAGDMLQCYSANVVKFHTWQADFVVGVSNRPRASRLARYLAEKKQSVVNQRHESVSLDPLTQQVVLLLDGTRDRLALLKRLRKLVEDGSFAEQPEDGSSTGAKKTGGSIKKAMDRSLARLARTALLVQ
jgi:methyltransferase-like protein/trans-aconitate methyltransferase